MGNKSSKKKAPKKDVREKPPKLPSSKANSGFMQPPPEKAAIRKKSNPSLRKASRRDSVKYNKDAMGKRDQYDGITKRAGMTTEELLAKQRAAKSNVHSLKTVSTVDDSSAWQPGAYNTHESITNKPVSEEGTPIKLTKQGPPSLAQPSSSSDSESEYSDEDIIEDWTQTPDEELQNEVDEKVEEEEINCIPETKFCTFFHQFTLEDQRILLDCMESKTYTDGQDVVVQGEMGHEFFIIKEGEVVVLKRDANTGEEKELTHLYRGQNFGEISMIYGGKRVASVRSIGTCNCLVLSKNVFEQHKHLRMFLITKKVPLLAELSQEDRVAIVNKLQPRSFNEGDYVITQGDVVVDDAFYMITSGKAAVVDGKKTLTRLYQGHCFGEMALISDKKRSASIVATTELKCMCLTKQDFNGALAGSVALTKILEKFAEERMNVRLKRRMSAKTLKLNRSQKKTLRQKSLSINDLFVETNTCEAHGSIKKGNRAVNQYQFKRELGKGAYSTVYLAVNSKTGQEVAIKVMDKLTLGKKSVGSKTSLLDDVYLEIRAQRLLRHEGIVQILESIDDPNHQYLYLIIECVQGGEILVEEPLPQATARGYFRDLLRGVEYMHYRGVVHRDIKPENILLTKKGSNGRTKIADFGTAVIVKKGETLTVPKGTPAFMAPELLSYDTIQYSGRSADIWSLGATLYMLVVGEPPWMATNEIELARKVKNDELVFPESTNVAPYKISPHLKQLIREMLTKEPNARPTLASVMAHEWVTKEGSEPLPLLYKPKGVMKNCVDDSKSSNNVLDDMFDGEILIMSDEDSSSDGSDFEEVSEGLDGFGKGSSSSLTAEANGLEPLDQSINFPWDKCKATNQNAAIRMVSASAENIGVRNNMEDKVVIEMSLSAMHDKTTKLNVFATFDGHGGDGTSSSLMMSLHSVIASQPGLSSDIDAALTRAWHIQDYHILRRSAKTLFKKRGQKTRSLQRTSKKMANEDNHLSGATAAMVVVIEHSNLAKPDDTNAVELVVAWAGDSRVVLSAEGGKAVDLSHDHKASRADETQRIRDAGGSVDYKGRVGGDLAVSRAFGDIMHKGVKDGDEFLDMLMTTPEEEASSLQSGPLICTPDISHHEVASTDEFFIIASDGVWDVLTSQQAVNYVRRFLVENNGDVEAAAQALVNKALHSGSVDNVSAVITVLNALST